MTYGYYGSNWFVNGVFIGAGPWYHRGWARPDYGGVYYDRGYYWRGNDRDGYRHEFVGRGFRGDHGLHSGEGWQQRGYHGGNQVRGRHG